MILVPEAERVLDRSTISQMAYTNAHKPVPNQEDMDLHFSPFSDRYGPLVLNPHTHKRIQACNKRSRSMSPWRVFVTLAGLVHTHLNTFRPKLPDQTPRRKMTKQGTKTTKFCLDSQFQVAHYARSHTLARLDDQSHQLEMHQELPRVHLRGGSF